MAKPNNEAPSQSADKYIVRLPEGMRDRIADAAKLNNRTMNAEIVARLQQSFEGGGVKDASDKLMVAGFVLRMVRSLVTDATVQADIDTMAKYISDASEDDQVLTAFEAVTRLQKRNEAKAFAGLKR